MINTLNNDIKNFRTKNAKECEITIGKETYKNIIKHVPIINSKYQGIPLYIGNFDYGYQLQ